MDADPVERRVLGALLEKQRLTPDVYPLTLNALRAACNQSTARDPVMQLDEERIRDALHRLGRRRWTRLASGAGSRAPKYRHLMDETLGLSREEQAVLAVLLLRGPQTSAELRSRTERMQHFASVDAVEAVLGRLADRGLARLRDRRPGEKEARWVELLGGEDEGAAPRAAAAAVAVEALAGQAAPAASAPPLPAVEPGRVEALEDEVRELRGEVAALRRELAALREELGA